MMSSPSPPLMMSLPEPPSMPVVAAVAVERVVADAGDQDVVRRRCRRARRDRRRCSAGSWCRRRRSPGCCGSTSGVRMPPPPDRRESSSLGSEKRRRRRSPGRLYCLRLVDLEDQAGRREHVRRQVGRVGVAHDHRGEGVGLHLAEQVQAVEALQVVEAVGVLQLLHLDFEDEVEGRAEHAAERHDLFGQAADPEIDVVEAAERAAGIGAGAVEEGDGVGRHQPARRPTIAGDDGQRGVALALERGLRGDQRMRAVGGDEVDDRGLVLEVVGEVDPAVVGLELGVVVGRLVELAPRRVERRHAGVAAARQVDGREVERQAEQVVAQRAGDELVDLVADLAGHAADDRAGRDVGVDVVVGAAVQELRSGSGSPRSGRYGRR